MAKRAGGPYAAVSAVERAKYVLFGHSLEHRTKTVWVYPPISAVTGEVVLSFDGDGKRPAPGWP